jgi:hypothetical protein
LRLPDSLHKKLKELAKRDHVSVNQMIASAVGEKVAALMTVDYLEERGKRGSRKALRSILKKVADRPPAPGDELT